MLEEYVADNYYARFDTHSYHCCRETHFNINIWQMEGWTEIWTPLSHPPRNNNAPTVKPVLSGHLKWRPKIGFQDKFSLNAGQKYCRMLQESILQYFQPSLSYHLSYKDLYFVYFLVPLSICFTVYKNKHTYTKVLGTRIRLLIWYMFQVTWYPWQQQCFSSVWVRDVWYIVTRHFIY